VTGRAPSGLLDTSVLIAEESGRRLQVEALPDNAFVSVVTIAELQAGVLAARDTAVRAIRLATLDAVSVLQPLTIDATAALHWAVLRVRLAEEGRRAKIWSSGSDVLALAGVSDLQPAISE